MVTESLDLSQDPSDFECSTSTHFCMSLAHKSVNLNEPQDIKEQVTTKFLLKKNIGYTWNPEPQRNSLIIYLIHYLQSNRIV